MFDSLVGLGGFVWISRGSIAAATVDADANVDSEVEEVDAEAELDASVGWEGGSAVCGFMILTAAGGPMDAVMRGEDLCWGWCPVSCAILEDRLPML